MSERGRTTKTRGLRFAGFVDAGNHGTINRRVGVYVSWLILAMMLISAAHAVSGEGFGVNSNAFTEIHWYLFAVLFLLLAACTLQRNKQVRMNIQRGVKPHSCPNDSIPATRNVVPERNGTEHAAQPMLWRLYQSWKIFRDAQYQWYRIAVASFSNFMICQQLPFR